MARNMFDLTGKIAVVTGGNSGLGLGFARGLAKQGATLIIWGRDKQKLESAKKELEGFGVRVGTRQVDATVEAEVVEGFNAAVKDFGRIDCAIANAGISTVRPVVEMSAADYDEMINISQRGAFFTLREAARHMVARAEKGDRGGSLIACGSLSQFLGIPGGAHYAAAKSAVAAIIRSLAVELGPYGIRANVLAAGYIQTQLLRAGDAQYSEWDQQFIDGTPLARLGTPADLEGCVAYLASDASSFHTGDTLIIDGGYMIKL